MAVVVTMIIMGIDPGLAAMGWGVIEAGGHVAHGCIRTVKWAEPLDRADEACEELDKVLMRYQPEAAAYEVFRYQGRQLTGAAQNVREVVGRVRQLLLAAGIVPGAYDAGTLHRAIAGSGGGKGAVQEAVRLRLGLPTAPRPTHAADALAVALYHEVVLRMQRLAGASGG